MPMVNKGAPAPLLRVEWPVSRLELLRRTVPLFPWIPLVPAALLIGTSLTALALAIRANRRAIALEGALERDARHEALHRQPLETLGP